MDPYKRNPSHRRKYISGLKHRILEATGFWRAEMIAEMKPVKKKELQDVQAS